MITEYWNGARRLLYNPCTDGEDYIFLSAPVGDERASRLPVDRDLWRREFPIVAEYWTGSARPAAGTGWSTSGAGLVTGNVAIIGDAAHAMPPNLGQAANTAFTNAMSLAASVTGRGDIEQALRDWEVNERPLTDHVQRLSYYYGFFLGKWRASLLALRGDILRALQPSAWIDEVLNRGMRHMPAGAGMDAAPNGLAGTTGDIHSGPLAPPAGARKVSQLGG